MPLFTDISPEILKDRHGLSPQQINTLFAKDVIKESLEEKAGTFEKVGEFIRITDALKNENIDFIPLKGPVLSFRLYGDATWRRYGDIDLMVEVAKVTGAAKLLTDLGYKPFGHTWPDNDIGQRLIVNHVHHILYWNSERELMVELHWRLFQTPAVSFRKIEELVKQNQSSVTLAGRSFRVLSHELELLYLIMHGSIHFWHRLKWILDVNALLISQNTDWELFNSMVRDLKAIRLVTLSKAILTEYFQDGPTLPCNEDVIPFMKAFSLGKIAEEKECGYESVSSKLQRWRYSFISYPGAKYKMNRIRNWVLFYVYETYRQAFGRGE